MDCYSTSPRSRKFCIRRNNNKVDSIETGRIVIAHLLPWSDLEKYMYTTLFKLLMTIFYRRYLIYKNDFTFSLFCTTYKLTSDKMTRLPWSSANPIPILNIKTISVIWLYVLIMSRTHFRVNPHSIFAWMLRNSLLESGKYRVWIHLKCVRDMIRT